MAQDESRAPGPSVSRSSDSGAAPAELLEPPKDAEAGSKEARQTAHSRSREGSACTSIIDEQSRHGITKRAVRAMGTSEVTRLALAPEGSLKSDGSPHEIDA